METFETNIPAGSCIISVSSEFVKNIIRDFRFTSYPSYHKDLPEYILHKLNAGMVSPVQYDVKIGEKAISSRVGFLITWPSDSAMTAAIIEHNITPVYDACWIRMR